MMLVCLISVYKWVPVRQDIKFWQHPLQWRHNDHDGVSNHQPHGCLLNRLFRRRSKKTSKLAFVWGIHRDRWISHTKGQLRGKYFHLMTSSRVYESAKIPGVFNHSHLLCMSRMYMYISQNKESSLEMKQRNIHWTFWVVVYIEINDRHINQTYVKPESGPTIWRHICWLFVYNDVCKLNVESLVQKQFPCDVHFHIRCHSMLFVWYCNNV